MIEQILQAVSDYTGISVDYMKSNSTKKDVAFARGLYYSIARMAGFSYADIGRKINKTHESVTRTGKKFMEYCDKDKKTKKIRNNILKSLTVGDKETSFIENQLFNENFYIADASLQYFGKYFVGMVDGCPCASGKSFHGVLNKMLDYNDDNSK